MTNTMYENNVTLVGQVMEITLSHRTFNTSYYELLIRVNRTTDGKYDDIPVIAPEWLAKNLENDKTIMIHGQLRIYKNSISTWQRKRIMVFAKSIRVVNDYSFHINQVTLIGDVHRVSPLRFTPLSTRLICDFSIIVHRADYNKFDTIFCIAWGNKANYVSSLKDGAKVKIEGRIQTRAFTKKHPDGSESQETVQEVSCTSVQLIK